MDTEQAGVLAASLESQEVGHDGAAAIMAVVNAYRRLDDEIGSAVRAALVQHNLRIISGLKAKSDKVRPSLGVAVAEFHQLAQERTGPCSRYDAGGSTSSAQMGHSDSPDIRLRQ